MIYDMGKKMNFIYGIIFAWFQKRCEHPRSAVVADILEGGALKANRSVIYCTICGAYKIAFPANGTAQQMWRLPHANWFKR